MKVDIWMPVYIGDLLKDTQDLDDKEFGAYMRILFYYWNLDGMMINDIDRIRKVTKYTAGEIGEIEYLLTRFFKLSGNKYTHKRADEELDKARGKRVRGQSAAETKWGRSSGGNTRAERLTEARKKGTHTEEEWEQLKKHIGKCLMCGAKDDLVKDHIIPIYQGGSDSIDNLQPLCHKCNSSKGADNQDLRPHNWKECLIKACRKPAAFVRERAGEKTYLCSEHTNHASNWDEERVER